MGAKPAPPCDENGAGLLATAFIAPKGLSEVSLGAGQRTGQRLGVLRRFRDSGADMRAGNEGRVTDKRNAAKSHARHLEVEHGGQDRFAGARHEARKSRRQERSGGYSEFRDQVRTDQRGRYGVAMAAPGGIGAPLTQGGTVVGRA